MENVAIGKCCISRSFGIFYGHLAYIIWATLFGIMYGSLWSFGIHIFPSLVCLDQENLATMPWMAEA
jgi:hypothetical protein